MEANYPIHRLRDRAGRRQGVDRRKVFIPGYEPDRRSGRDRRSNEDRRTQNDQAGVVFLRRNMDRYMEFANANKGITYGLISGVSVWGLLVTILIFKFWS
jgi:hypothetical protein